MMETAGPKVRRQYRGGAVAADSLAAGTRRAPGVFRALPGTARAVTAGCRGLPLGVLAGDDRTRRIFRTAGFRPYAPGRIRDLDPTP